jgi:hypothetical protein
MDDRIAKLKTARDALSFAGNARRLGHTTLADSAMQRASELRATEEGFISPAEQAIATALYAYEEQQSRLTGRVFRASRTRQMFSSHGPLAAAERIVLHRQPSKGYEVLEEAGLEALSFEAIIDRFPEEFSGQALEAARARLRGRSAPMAIRPPSVANEVSDPTVSALHRTFVMDAEAVEFFEAFQNPPTWFVEHWLPRYQNTVSLVADGLARQQPADLFGIIWKHADNSISHAGLGLLKYETVDRLRPELVQVIRDIQHDGSPKGFQAIVSRFESWKDAGLIGKVPRLLIARAFAAIHPHRYHTTVDAGRQNTVLKWFAKHTGFVTPAAGDWATRAQALTAHLDSAGAFGEDVFRRNVFPWFVIDRLSNMSAAADIPPGHSPRPVASLADLPPEQRQIKLRHNAVQTALYAQLVTEFGEQMVWTEYPLGNSCFADAIARLQDGRRYLYEIKIAPTAMLVIRQAMGQLLEYGFRQGGLEPAKLFVVGEPSLDETSASFLARLRREFNLEIEYLQVTLDDMDVAFTSDGH